MSRRPNLGIFRPRPAPEPPRKYVVDLADGRDFNPADVSDSLPRIIITQSPQSVAGETVYVTHVDTAFVRDDAVLKLYRLAEPVIHDMDDRARGRTDGQ